MLAAVNFHYIRPHFGGKFEAIHGLTPAEFERQLEALGRLGRFVSADDIRISVEGGRSLPPRALVVTIDDGLREQYEYAWPVLQRRGIPAIFYINTAPLLGARVSTVHKIHLLRSELSPSEFLRMLQRHAADGGIDLGQQVDAARAQQQYEYDTPDVAHLKYLLNLCLTPAERDTLIERCFDEQCAGEEQAISKALYMDDEQIRSLGRARAVGIHGHEHVPLGLLPPLAAEEQIRLCLDGLETIVGYRPFTLSYPFGERDACSEEAGSLAARHGIQFAFTMERAANHDLRHPLHLARFDSNDAPGGKRPYWSDGAFFASAPAATWCRVPVSSGACDRVRRSPSAGHSDATHRA